MSSKDVHNAHMLIPRELWVKIERLSIIEDRSKTDIVCEAIASLLVSRKHKLNAAG